MKFPTQTIDKIISLKKELDSLDAIQPKDEKKLKEKLRLEFNYNSNHLEGNTLTYGQTKLLFEFDKISGDVQVSDIEEMKAHDLALTFIEEIAKDIERPLTEQFIKEINKTILVKPFWKDAVTPNGSPTRKKIEIGTYKSSPNSVQLKNGKIHEYATPEETPALMGELLDWYHSQENNMHPIQLAAEFHYRFVCIHPFDDGNGRVARLIMNYILLKNDFPPVVVKSEDKESYLTALQKADIGDRTAIIEYIEEQLIWSLELCIKAAKGEDLEESGDLEKEIELLRREKLTKEVIRKTPKTTFDLTKYIEKEIWKLLKSTSYKFNDFFTEINEELSINGKVNEIKQQNIKYPSVPIIGDTKPHSFYGFDFDKNNINSISWEIKLLALKSSSSNIDFKIRCHLIFKDINYELIIQSLIWKENYSLPKEDNTVFSTKKKYNEYITEELISEIIKKTSKSIISAIKELE